MKICDGYDRGNNGSLKVEIDTRNKKYLFFSLISLKSNFHLSKKFILFASMKAL